MSEQIKSNIPIESGDGGEQQPENLEGKNKQITISKSELDEYRLQKAYDEAFDRFQDSIHWSAEVANIVLGNGPEVILKYLHDNEDRLSEEAKFFLKVTLETKKVRKTSESDKEQVTLSGEEVKDFVEYKKNIEYKKSEELMSKFLDSDNPRDKSRASEIINLTMQKDPTLYDEYINKNRDQLTPIALDFIKNSLRIKLERHYKEQQEK